MKNIYVLFGTEPYLLEKKKNEIIRSVLNEEDMEFGVSAHDMRGFPLTNAIDDASTLSFLCGKRVVIAKDAYFLTGEKAKEKVEHDMDRLMTYLIHPCEDSILILTVQAEKLDARKKVVKALKKAAEHYEAKPLSNDKLSEWLYQTATSKNVEIDNEAIHLLITFIGSNLTSLEQELTKMALFVGKGNTISKTIVEQLVSKSLEQDIFVLIDRIVHKDREKAFEMLGDMFRQGEDPVKILLLLARQFRILLQIQQLKGYSNSEIATKLKLHPYVVSIAQGQAREYEKITLLDILQELANLDYMMKTGKVDKHLALETFITKLA